MEILNWENLKIRLAIFCLASVLGLAAATFGPVAAETAGFTLFDQVYAGDPENSLGNG